MRFLLLLYISSLMATEDIAVQRLQAFDVLAEPEASKEAVEEAVNAYPNSIPVVMQGIKNFARAYDIDRMMWLFHRYQALNPSDPYPRDLLEEMAWGVIQKGSTSVTPITRAIALIAAAIGNDARGVSLLADKMSDPHRLIRVIAIEFAAHFRDGKLQEKVLERLKTEQDPAVHIELVSAVGAMQIKQAIPYLYQVIESNRSIAEEKAAAIAALLELEHPLDKNELERCSKCNRAGLRILAAEYISETEKPEYADLLIMLLKDPLAEVRQSALMALGSLRLPDVRALVEPLTADKSSEVAIIASYVLMLSDPALGQEKLKPWFKSEKKEERLFAATLLSAAGKYGFPLTFQAFLETKDPFVKLNLAKTLVLQKVHEKEGTEALYQLVCDNSEKWMLKKVGPYEVIAPCDVNHRPDVPNYPEAVNQTTRLEILNELAIAGHPQAEKAIRCFLHERPWGVTGAASTVLLTEGSDEAIELIKSLLNDPSEKIQLQAAIILGAWGSDPDAISTLQKLYPKAAKHQKDQILEALGKIADKSTLPFLVERLEDTQPSLRLISAAAILQTLYN